MNAQQLLQHFHRIAEAPDAVPRLRQFILDLAVRGKLVEQDPNDEPAAELLKRILTEKAQSVKEGKTRRQEALPEVQIDELPFAVPRTWQWVRLGDILTKLTDGTHHSPPNGRQGAFKYVTAKNIKQDGVSLVDITYVSTEVHADIYARCNPEKGDILYIKDGATTGVATINDLDEPFSMLSSVALLKLPTCVYNRLVVDFLVSPFFYDQMRGFMKGAAITRVTLKRMLPALIPLPPVAEQYRIVAKVNELMALCDRLETAQAERESRRARLVAASLNRLNNGADAESFREHARFHLRQLPRLTTRPEHIQRLRETILQLAVTGRLSEQRPDDGDARDLLRRLSTKRRKARKGSTGDPAESPEPLPPLPKTWTWAIIDQVAAEDDNAITDGPFGANLKTAHYVNTPGYRVIRLQNIGRGHFRMEHRSYIDKERFERLAKHRIFAGELVVAGLVDPLVRCCEVPHEMGPALVKADCYRFKVHPNFSSRFALYYLNSPLCQHLAAVHHHGMTLVRIGLGNFRRIPIPVPPLAEQQRIVAKVEELLTLCDRLDATLVASQAESRRLLDAVLYEALASSSIPSTQRLHDAQERFDKSCQGAI